MPVTLPKKYVLITAGMFWNFTNTFFPRKPDTGYFNYSSFGLKQLSKGKTLTERHSPFFVGLQKVKYFTVLR